MRGRASARVRVPTRCADMTGHSIFLSYSSKHCDLTRTLVEAIEAQYGPGSVWWDHALESWADYEIQIRNALNEARVVVVLWTKAAAESDWVKSEAGRASTASKLVNVRASDTSWREVPSPHDQHHVIDLVDTPGILRSIAAVWTGRPVRTAVPLHEIHFRQHGQRLIDAKQRALPRDPRGASPSELLQAGFEVVGYQDVTGLQAQLFDWCTRSRRATVAQLIHGPGVVGKTRLMISVAERLRNQGWTAGFLARPHEAFEATLKQRRQALEQLIDNGEDHGLLVVVDYAEARQDDIRALAGLVSQRTEDESRPVRVVLLARHAGEWWTNLHDESPDIQRLFRSAGGDGVVTELPPVSGGGHRRALFEASLAAFGPLLDVQGVARPAGTPSVDHLTRIETGSGYSRPLAIQMAALIWLASAGPQGGMSDVEELLRLVLGLERNHWRKILGELDEERTRDVARGVAQVTAVLGTPTAASTERLLMADDFYSGRRTARADVDRVSRDLARVYGRTDGGLLPLEPDLIGEHHVASVGDIELLEGCLRWIEAVPRELQEQRRRDVLTVLQRATQSEHGTQATARAANLLDHLVGAHATTHAAALVAVTVDTPGVLVDVLDRRVAGLNTTALGALDDALPPQSLSLLDVSMKMAARWADLARHAL